MRGFLLGVLAALVMGAALLGAGWALSGERALHRSAYPCQYDSMEECPAH